MSEQDPSDQISVIDDGIGRPLETPIATLPPVAMDSEKVPVSAATGQPRRNPVMIFANVFLYAGAAVSAVSLGIFWWLAIHMETFIQSAQLITRLDPRPGSKESIFAVIAVMAMNTAVIAVLCIAAFQSWNGHRWSRIAAIFAMLLSCTAYFLHPLAWYVVPFAVVGAVILWLPPVKRYFDNWDAFRELPVKKGPREEQIHYGPLARFS